MENLGILGTRLHLLVQRRLIDELARRGHTGIRARHGAVLAHVGDGARATELSSRSGRSKQTVTRLIDELERLGYVERLPDPRDRRSKIVVLTELGATEVADARDILTTLGRSCATAVGPEVFDSWRTTTAHLVEHLAQVRPQAPTATPTKTPDEALTRIEV